MQTMRRNCDYSNVPLLLSADMNTEERMHLAALRAQMGFRGVVCLHGLVGIFPIGRARYYQETTANIDMLTDKGL